MSDWTAERVLALAPDAASVAPGRELANPAKWESIGCDVRSAWGEAKGSGAKPYQVAVDLNGPAFKCSCPSRKIPCKHVLGLLLRFAAKQAVDNVAPDWVTEWLDKRSAKPAAKEPRTEPDAEAAAKRQDRRWDKILAGLDECEAFLVDVAGQGLLATQSARSWDQMAARMIDAQAPGLARRVRRVGARIGIGPDWGAEVAGDLGGTMLLIEATRRLESLGKATRADVRAALGIPVRKEDLEGERVVDTWDVLGQAIEEEDKLTTFRSWLRGRATKRWAMHLAFMAPGQPPERQLSPGSAMTAEMQFYPSSWPLRAHVVPSTAAKFEPESAGVWEGAFEELASALAAHPWVDRVPACIANARLARTDGEWMCVDAKGAAVRIVGRQPWSLLALTGNSACDLFGEFRGVDFRPLGAWAGWGYLAI